MEGEGGHGASNGGGGAKEELERRGEPRPPIRRGLRGPIAPPPIRRGLREPVRRIGLPAPFVGLLERGLPTPLMGLFEKPESLIGLLSPRNGLPPPTPPPSSELPGVASLFEHHDDERERAAR